MNTTSSGTITIRLSAEEVQALDEEVTRLSSDPSFSLLRVSRNSVLRWALQRWIRDPVSHPRELFEAESTADQNEVEVDLCASCGEPIESQDRVELFLLGHREVRHILCTMLTSAEPVSPQS